MQWLNILAVLACPVMMLLCMKGMFSGHKDTNEKGNRKGQAGSTTQELQSLQITMADLIKQNHHLSEEIKTLKDGK